MTTYIMTLKIIQKNLPTVLEVLKGSAELVSLNVEQETVEVTKSSRYAGGKHLKGITGKDLVLQLLAKAPTSVKEFINKFEKHGFSPNSYSPIASKLLAVKEIVKLPNGKYALNTK